MQAQPRTAPPEPKGFLTLLSSRDCDALLELGSLCRFELGEHLMRQEEPGDPVLLLHQGHVKATFVEPHGKEIVLSFHGPGDVLGELSFVRAEPRSSNVVAIEPVEARALAAADFRAFLEERPGAALALFDAIGRRFRDANRTQVQFGASDTIGRIAARLVELCERHGHLTPDGIEIRLPITQQDLGGWTGSSRAGVASALKTMRGLGWIRTERKRIIVLEDDWTEVLAGGPARAQRAYFNFGPRLPRRRLVSIFADHPLHMSGRINRSVDVGAHRLLRLDARMPHGELVEALNAFQPEGLATYPSTAALLAERQLAGELQIHPQMIFTSGEVRTAETKELIVAAWNRTPFDNYGVTETGSTTAAECDRHMGLHLFEDQVLMEVVDDDYQPVPDGEPGSRLLITNLYNRTQPLIRYELTDLVTVSPDPCPCGRPFRLLKSVEGRSDDVLEMPARDGGTIKVHPLTLRSPLAGIAALSEYKIVYGAGEVLIGAVLNGGGNHEQACREIEARLGAALIAGGAQAPPIHVKRVGTIPRHPHSGKHKAVEVAAA